MLNNQVNVMDEHYFGLTDVGRVRTNNEDTFMAQPVQDGRYILAAAIDGVGGYNGGEIAAEIAREQLENQFLSAHTEPLQALVNAFGQGNAQIYARKQQERDLDSMACVATAALVDIENNQFYYVHVGDTRLYLFRDHSLIKITNDQSFVGFLEDSGRLSEAAAMQHPKRNEINKALGFGNSLTSEKDYIETGHSPFLPGDLLLLCSDGLTDMVDRQQITAVLLSDAGLAQKAQQLIEAANRNGGRDNVTVVLVHNYKQPQQHIATKPVNTEIQQPAVLNKVVPQTQEMPPESNPAPEPIYKSNYKIVILLSLLCLAFLAAAAWFYWQAHQQKPLAAVPATIPAAAQQQQQSTQLLKLQDTINKLKGNTLQLTGESFAVPLILNDTLKINKDTLYIKGRLIFKAGTGYTGPAIALGPACRKVVLNGVSFDGFRTGIASINDALQLQQVRFVNCTYPVQVAYVINSAVPVSIRVPMLRYQTDTSTVTKPVPPHGAR
ncbi:PP2C family protein-serine/threonine phosphatase [Mucilaginibacter sp.]